MKILFKSYFTHSYQVIIAILQRFLRDGCMTRAAALTYTSLLSLVPLMTVSFAVLAAFPFFKMLSIQIQNFIFEHFVATSGEIIQSYLQHFVAQTANLSAIGFFFLVVTAILMMYNMEQSFNDIWHVKYRRKGASAFMLYWAVLTLSPLLLGISILLSSYVVSMPIISDVVTTLGLNKFILSMLPFVFITLLFALLYITVPNCKVPIRYGFVGAVVATILFELARAVFAFYIKSFSMYTLLYGALATIPIFLLWLYTSWVIILFGATISAVLTLGVPHHSQRMVDPFTHIFMWLGYFWRAMQVGKGLTLHQLVSMDSVNYEVDPESQLELMMKKHLIQPASNGYYVLSHDLSTMTLLDLHRLLPWRLPNVVDLQQSQGIWEQGLFQILEKLEETNKNNLAFPLAEIYKSSKA